MLELIISIISAATVIILNASGQNFPQPLEADEEIALFREMKGIEGDTARTKLIEHNLRLVAHIVRKYYSGQDCADDLISIGTIGLIKAIDSFDVEKGAKFATYSAKCIQNEILMYFRSKKKFAYEVSINETIDTDRDGNPLTYIDIIRVEDTIAEDIDKKIKTKNALDFIRNNLDEREKKVIILRYGLGESAPITQREVAKRLGISRSYISRIEKGALEKINQYLK